MNILHKSIKWVMLLSGALTCTMFYAAVAPEASLLASFGQSMDGPVAQVVVRSWGVLIGLMGLLLVYGSFNESARRTALIFAGASKVAFILLVLSFGQQFLQFQIGVAVAIDAVMVTLFSLYLFSAGKRVNAENVGLPHTTSRTSP